MCAVSRFDFNAQRLFVEGPLAAGARIELDRDRAHYLVHVLRMGPEDHILVFDGRHGEWLARLDEIAKKSATLLVESQVREQTAAGKVVYAFAPLKHARLDYLVQKAVEMGACELAPVITRRTQVTRINAERMRANVIEAAEQCGILSLPRLRPESRLDPFLDQVGVNASLVFCDEDAPVHDSIRVLNEADLQASEAVVVLIGPEGGFAPEERARLLQHPRCVRLSLGPRILRADTAGVAALALVQAFVEGE